MKQILGYEGLYSVTGTGEVWSHANKRGQKGRKGKFLKAWLVGAGYKSVMLYKEDISKKFLVHRLVAVRYIPNPKNLPEVNHKDSNKLNNTIANLEWVSSKENKHHAISLGLYKNTGKNTPSGDNSPIAKLSYAKASKIRKIYQKGRLTQKKIGIMFGVSDATIGLVVGNKIWFHK